MSDKVFKGHPLAGPTTEIACVAFTYPQWINEIAKYNMVLDFLGSHGVNGSYEGSQRQGNTRCHRANSRDNPQRFTFHCRFCLHVGATKGNSNNFKSHEPLCAKKRQTATTEKLDIYAQALESGNLGFHSDRGGDNDKNDDDDIVANVLTAMIVDDQDECSTYTVPRSGSDGNLVERNDQDVTVIEDDWSTATTLPLSKRHNSQSTCISPDIPAMQASIDPQLGGSNRADDSGANANSSQFITQSQVAPALLGLHVCK